MNIKFSVNALFALSTIAIFAIFLSAEQPVVAETAVSDPAVYRQYLPIIMNNYNSCTNASPKKGVAWESLSRRGPNDHRRLCIAWYHHWTIQETPSHFDNVAHVQHFWCDYYPSNAGSAAEIRIDYRQRALDYLGSDYDGYLLFLNEPDLDAPQCNRSPAAAAVLYQWLKQNLPQAKLVGPQVSHKDYLNDWLWLQSWRAEVMALTGTAPDMDAYAIHDYIADRPASAQVASLHALMQSWGEGDKLIWVTEYGAAEPAKMAEMTRFYTNDARIARFAGYSPYMQNSSAGLHFFDWNTRQLTAVGQAFAHNGFVSNK